MKPTVTPLTGFVVLPQEGDLHADIEVWYTAASAEESQEEGESPANRFKLVNFSHASIDGNPVNNLN